MLGTLAALVVGAFLLVLEGGSPSPFTVYREGLEGAFGSSFAVQESLLTAVPLVLTAGAAAVAFRASIYNIGGEGQMYVGAIAGAFVGLTFGDDLAGIVVIPLVLVGGVVAGGFWALLAAIPKARWQVNEVLPTLMLNFVALNLMNYFIFGTTSIFRDPVTSTFPAGAHLPDPARLPVLTDRLDLSVLIAPGAILLVAALLTWTRWGFALRITGDSPSTARYAGVRLPRMILTVMFTSGGLAGLAGAVLVAGRVGALEPRTLAVNLGYLGIVVAALSRLNLVAVIPVAVLFGALDTAKPSMQVLGVPDALILVIEGSILFFVIVGDFWLRHTIAITRRESDHDHSVALAGAPLEGTSRSARPLETADSEK
ncbi:MAG: ABC transporter permease [Acidimicrobiia bacterium]